MDRSRETLTPPNDHPHHVLPGNNRSVSKHASSHDSVIAVYRHGIGFIDQVGAMQGYLTLIGFWGSFMPLWMVFDYNARRGIPWMMVAAVLVCALIIRADNIKYHYYPVLFDRAAKKFIYM